MVEGLIGLFEAPGAESERTRQRAREESARGRGKRESKRETGRGKSKKIAKVNGLEPEAASETAV